MPGVVLLFFDRLESAARGALEIAGMDASACDLMDRRLLSIAREADVRYDLLIPRDAEAMLLVEVQGETARTKCGSSCRTWWSGSSGANDWPSIPGWRWSRKKSSCSGGWRDASCRDCTA